MSLPQAASAIESFKIESPVKKLDFGGANKENILVEEAKPKELVKEEVKAEEVKTVAAPTIKSFEADEPLLQENPQRFVLFPIKYHEVSDIAKIWSFGLALRVMSRRDRPRRVK